MRRQVAGAGGGAGVVKLTFTSSRAPSSASKNSDGWKPNMFAMMTLGNVCVFANRSRLRGD